MKLLEQVFLYAGVTREEFESVRPDINKSNKRMTGIFSALASVLIITMCIVSIFVNSTSQNRVVYAVGAIGAMLIFIASALCSEKQDNLILALVYISFSVFHVYGIFIGTITNPTQQTVTFIVMLVFMPLLFIDRPVRILLAMLTYILIFIYLCYKNKTGDVLSTDVMDAIIYGILGYISGVIINHIKVKSFVLEHKLHDASRLDQLTQMNNRNSFESDLGQIAEECSTSLVCIYVDVNGLHELNNTKGHLQGDIMLQFVASKMCKAFGNEHSYRIGGDEFVSFLIDTEEFKAVELLEGLSKVVEAEGYHIAAGLEYVEASQLQMDELIKSAETKMYQRKSRYYQENARDRRK